MASLADRLADVLVSIASAIKDAKKGYSGGLPPIGWHHSSMGVLSTGTGSNTVSGRIYLHAYDIPAECEWDAFCYTISTAVAGGTGVSWSAALYGSDAFGWPDLASGPIIPQTALVLSSTGNKQASITPIRLKPGRYWTATLYLYTSAPTTHFQTQCDSNNAQGLPRPTSQIVSGGAIRGYYLGGPYASIGAIAGSPVYNVSGSLDVPVLGLRRSA